jgi:hypothetical protein
VSEVHPPSALECVYMCVCVHACFVQILLIAIFGSLLCAYPLVLRSWILQRNTQASMVSLRMRYWYCFNARACIIAQELKLAQVNMGKQGFDAILEALTVHPTLQRLDLRCVVCKRNT